MKTPSAFQESRRALRAAEADLKEWLDDPDNTVIWDRCQADFVEALGRPEPESLPFFGFISNFLASRGVHSILNGMNGWHDVHHAWRCEFFDFQMASYYFERVEEIERNKSPTPKPSLWKRLNDVLEGNQPPPPRPPYPVRDGHTIGVAAQMWAYAEICAQHREADYLMRTVNTFLPRLTRIQLHFQHLPPFLLWLWQKKTAQNGPVELLKDVDYRAYRAIIECWDKPELLEPAIIEAGEYHCRGMFDGDDYPEFYHMPYTFVPVEFLAMRKVRNDLGLETPDVNHPLLESLCAKIQGSPDEVHDDLLKKAEEKLSILWSKLQNPIVPW